jgi:transposase-like protein
MGKKRRDRWTASEARAALDAQERSGLTIQAFCRDQGWQPDRLYRWRRRLAVGASASDEEVGVGAPSFVRAEVNGTRLVPAPSSSLSTAMFELVLCSGQRLRFSSEIEPAVLARTVRALEVEPC